MMFINKIENVVNAVHVGSKISLIVYIKNNIENIFKFHNKYNNYRT